MSLYGVIGYHVTLSAGHMIANHPIYWGDWLSCDPLEGNTCAPSCGSFDFLSQIYSCYIRGDRSLLTDTFFDYHATWIFLIWQLFISGLYWVNNVVTHLHPSFPRYMVK